MNWHQAGRHTTELRSQQVSTHSRSTHLYVNVKLFAKFHLVMATVNAKTKHSFSS